MKIKKRSGRLAMREEGSLWVAYYALPNTMEGALFLGSIRMEFVRDLDRKAVFIDLMKEAIGDKLRELTGGAPTWEGMRPAPEHERSGTTQ
jgi:uncharacterized protein YbcI